MDRVCVCIIPTLDEVWEKLRETNCIQIYQPKFQRSKSLLWWLGEQ